MTRPNAPKNPRKGAKAWHFALAILAIALVLRVALGALPAPPDETNPDAKQGHLAHAPSPADTPNPEPSAIEILPFDLHGEIPGPLLTGILKRYLPDSTADHADDLRDTLPPGEDPRMIVILPEGEGELF